MPAQPSGDDDVRDPVHDASPPTSQPGSQLGSQPGSQPGSQLGSQLGSQPGSLAHGLAAMPKAELHVHLEGAIPPALALDLAARHGVRLPGDERGLDGIRDAYRYRSFEDFKRIFLAVSGCLRSEDDFLAVLEAMTDAAQRDGVVWSEITVTPMTHVLRGVAIEALLSALAEGRRRAAQRGVGLRFVFDVVRSFPDHGLPTLEAALAGRDAGVIGLGLGGPEREGDLAAFAELFTRARAEGLRALPHAGELAPARNVRDAVQLLGATRVGHGIRAIDEPAVLALLRERGVVLEVCPSSNLALGAVPSWADHPLPRLLAAGVQVVLGSDDPPLFHTTLGEEYLRCAQHFGWGLRELVERCQASLQAAVMAETDRAKWLAELARVARSLGEPSPAGQAPADVAGELRDE
jgi:adenosine deaminase